MRLRARPIWLVLLFACGDPSAGTEVGNPTFACSGNSTSASGDHDGGDGGGRGCDPGAVPTFRCGAAGPCELIDFGEVAVGGTGTLLLAVENEGCEDVELSLAEFEGRGGFYAGPTFPTVLPAGGRLEWTVGFVPAVPGPTGGELRFTLVPGGERVLPWIGTGL